jgi:hypothetical protein
LSKGTRAQPFEGKTVAIRRHGQSTELVDQDGETIVWDTPERRPYLAAKLARVSGSVLLFGLGLGTTLGMLLEKADHITVVEINKEVLDWVSPFYPEEKIRYVHADATKWKPDRDFDWLVDMTVRTIIKPMERKKS